MSARRFPSPEAFLGGRAVRVHVVGAGGTGSMAVDFVGRLDRALRNQGHPGLDVTVFDDAVVREANVGRQKFTPHDVGFPKAVLLVHRIQEFYRLQWKAVVARYAAGGPGCDLLFTCVDRGDFRYKLGKHYHERRSECLWLDVGNGATAAQVVFGHLGAPAEGLRLPNVYDFYGKQLLAADDDDLPSCSLAEALTRQRWSMNPMVAAVAGVMLDNLFHHGGLDEATSFIQLEPLSVTSIPAEHVSWEMLGYSPKTKKKTKKG